MTQDAGKRQRLFDPDGPLICVYESGDTVLHETLMLRLSRPRQGLSTGDEGVNRTGQFMEQIWFYNNVT